MNKRSKYPFQSLMIHNAHPNAIIRGKKIFVQGGVDAQKINFEKTGHAIFIVQSQSISRNYKVIISNFLQNEQDEIKISCQCPYTLGGFCKHEIAALFILEQTLYNDQYLLKNTYSKTNYDPAHTEIEMVDINEKTLQRNSSPNTYNNALDFATENQVHITTTSQQKAICSLKLNGETQKVIIQKIAYNRFLTSCGCTETLYKLCLHKLTAFLQIKYTKGESAFDWMQDLDDDKNILLKQYGYTLKDDIDGLFTFQFKKGLLKIKPNDKSIVKISKYNDWHDLKDTVFNNANNILTSEILYTAKNNVDFSVGYAFNFLYGSSIIDFEITPLKGKLTKDSTSFASHVKRLYENTDDIISLTDDIDRKILQLCKDLKSDGGLGDFINTLNHIRTYVNRFNAHYLIFEEFSLEIQQKVYNYVLERLNKLVYLLQNKLTFLHDDGYYFSKNTIEPLNLSNENIKPYFILSENNNFIELRAYVKVGSRQPAISNQQTSVDSQKSTGNAIIPIDKFNVLSKWFASYNDNIFLINGWQDYRAFIYFIKKPIIKINKKDRNGFITNFIIPLHKNFNIEINMDIKIKEKKITPKAKVYLKELDSFLLFTPVLDYDGTEVEIDGRSEILKENGKQLIKILRDEPFEENFKKLMSTLHPNFEGQINKHYYYLPFDEILKDDWFFSAFEKIRENKIEILGYNQLTKLKYNTHKPRMKVNVSSGIDWFDVHIEIQFGDQLVNLKDVRKAIFKNENYVKLGDGTLGLLPDEWLKKYATLFKMGNVKEDGIEVSKMHFSIVDELYNEITDKEIIREIEEKKEKLLNFSNIKETPVPDKIKAKLRDYQIGGFNWLNFLNDFGWGGCLADDMGLGKTLQMLTFLQHQKLKIKEKFTSLVVSPTTLIFNWENEVEKFTPNISIYAHSGTDRPKTTRKFSNYDIIITSYGTLISDIEFLSKFSFRYVILDESQSIKNPASKRYKAARLLQARNRFALTGTPIENNTFDLYSQMNFLNPGLLGNMEFFKKEFSTPIDKYGDKSKTEQLKKLVYPFLLRRKKEHVAKELPDKTETVLYCEFENRQRKVYDAFKNRYRNKIMNKIEDVGIKKAGIYILEGLLKLRQICDSPALLNNEEDYGDDSIKADELMRHIKEKTGDHKILVFSQFLGMLALIRKRIENENIDYEYLDGSTKNRRQCITRFQNEEKCRVFLISLKAGGLGINLTKADYVYIVDPWWNPAVEQQAIDRTHRIGQDRHIFAYKMVCKDTVEEKILQLQEKKKRIAKDLIDVDKGFIKNLKKTDIEALFS